MAPWTVLFIFHAGSRRLGFDNFRNSSYKQKTAGSASISVFVENYHRKKDST